MFVPYDCYYHLYNKDSLYQCAAATDVKWILTMGDSQEREFVGVMKNMNGSTHRATKFEWVRLAAYASGCSNHRATGDDCVC